MTVKNIVAKSPEGIKIRQQQKIEDAIKREIYNIHEKMEVGDYDYSINLSFIRVYDRNAVLNGIIQQFQTVGWHVEHIPIDEAVHSHHLRFSDPKGGN